MRKKRDNWEIISNIYSWAIEILLLSLFLFNKPLSALEKLLPVFHFNQLTSQDGLRNFEIRSEIVRDRQGLIWIGTANGLACYDGYTCKTYYNKPDDQYSISSNGIIELKLDKRGRLWIGTWSTGFSLYDSEKDRIINFLPKINDSTWNQGKSIFAIHEDHLGNIWVGSNRGVILVNNLEFQNETNYDSIAHKIKFRTFKSVEWGGCAERGLFLSSDGGFVCRDEEASVTEVIWRVTKRIASCSEVEA